MMYRLLVSAVVLGLLQTGCHFPGTGIDTPQRGNGPRARKPAYGWGFNNATGPELADVGMKWDAGGGRTLSSPAGFLPQGKGGAWNDLGWDPIPARATIRWRVAKDASENPDSPMLSQEVEIASQIPDIAKFSGTIWLQYIDGHWRVAPVAVSESERRQDLIYTRPPRYPGKEKPAP